MSWVVKVLAWLWGNREEIAADVEHLVDPHEEPTQPLPASALAHQRAQIDAATHAKARPMDHPAVSSSPTEGSADAVKIREQAGPGGGGSRSQ